MAAPAPSVPPAFQQVCSALREARPRPDVDVTEVPAPTRLAPHSLALALELPGPPEGEPLATGRFVVLHDPREQQGWGGDTRLVTFLRAGLDDDMTRDPLLAEVAWSWLGDALAGRGVAAATTSGTVTTTVSRRFGAGAGDAHHGTEPEVGEVELRCSWTPLPGSGPAGRRDAADPAGAATPDLVAHLGAFCDLLGLAAGAPPLRPGVALLRRR